jgi:hypothetical protein
MIVGLEYIPALIGTAQPVTDDVVCGAGGRALAAVSEVVSPLSADDRDSPSKDAAKFCTWE